MSKSINYCCPFNISRLKDSVKRGQTKDIEINGLCLESYPCQHRVTFKPEGINITLNAIEIKKILDILGKPIPEHFL